MPFGVTNAPATFQELMNSILSKYLRNFVLVFFDDILVYSKTETEHRRHLRTVLQIIRLHSLKARLSKCSFGTSQVEYLGHIISGSCLATDPSKIKEILSWHTSTTIKQLRGFLGLTGYYRRFVAGYASIYNYKPLHDSLKKNAFQWGPTQDKAFQQLKLAMTTPPVLALPNFYIPFSPYAAWQTNCLLQQKPRS